MLRLTHKTANTTAADDSLECFFIVFFFFLREKKKGLIFHVNPLLARQRIRVKHQVLFSSKDKSKNKYKTKVCRLLQFCMAF